MEERQNEELREIEHEREVDDEKWLESNEARHEAIRIARLVLLGPIVLMVGWIFFLVRSDHAPDPVVLVMFLAILSAFWVTYAGIACGWLAHRICWGSSIPVGRMAIALVLTCDLTLFGWYLVVLLR